MSFLLTGSAQVSALFQRSGSARTVNKVNARQQLIRAINQKAQFCQFIMKFTIGLEVHHEKQKEIKVFSPEKQCIIFYIEYVKSLRPSLIVLAAGFFTTHNKISATYFPPKSIDNKNEVSTNKQKRNRFFQWFKKATNIQ